MNTSRRAIWPHLIAIAALMVLRRPDAVLHPQFWAEDGQVFYHDAYTYSWHSLFLPLGGYLNSLCRLTALLAVTFPLVWAPRIFMAVAAFFQLLPVWVMLSSRMTTAIPNANARLALAYFYALLPNSYELNLNLTNAKWHLALVAFMLLVGRPSVRWWVRVLDGVLLATSGLDGPFAIFLLPVAWLEVARQKSGIGKALILFATAVVQMWFILASHASSNRLVTPLGASVPGLIHIMMNQIFLGGLVGSSMMTMWLGSPSLGSCWLAGATVLLAGWMFGVALHRGSAVYCYAALFAATMLFAALSTPVASAVDKQWIALARPGTGLRYFAMPTLLWFGTGLVFLGLPSRMAQVPGIAIMLAAVFGVVCNLQYPPFTADGFTMRATEFQTARLGSVEVFPENPAGWKMVLQKDE